MGSDRLEEGVDGRLGFSKRSSNVSSNPTPIEIIMAELCKLSVARSACCAWVGRRSHAIKVKAIKEASGGGLTAGVGAFADGIVAGAGRGCVRAEVQHGAQNVNKAAPRIEPRAGSRRACVAQADRRRRGFALSQRSNVRMPSLDTALPGAHTHMKIP